MQALSHFSYHYSGGKYVICDLQGGRYRNCYVLTDPVILSHVKAFGCTDMGQVGIDNFMAHHKCGRFCDPAWRLPKVEKLVPTMKPVSGTTFGFGKPLFSSKTVKELQVEVRKFGRSSSPHLPMPENLYELSGTIAELWNAGDLLIYLLCFN